MKLYYSPGSCSLAPHIVLEEIGKPYQTLLVSSMDGSTSSTEYLQVNPKARVPALDMGGEILTEVPAIVVYLALSNPDAKLLDNTPYSLARAMEWMNWLSSGIHALAVAQNWRVERFTNDEKGYQGIREKGMQNLVSSYRLVEEKLTENNWADKNSLNNKICYAVGESYSVVDPYLLVFYRWGNRLGLDMKSLYPNWTLQTQLLLERPAVVNVLAAEGISVWE